MSLTNAQFSQIFPHAPLAYAVYVNSAMAQYQINTPIRVSMFLAQVGHETGDLQYFVESLNYSAEGLANTWRNRYALKDANGNYIQKRNVQGVLRYQPNALANKLNRNPVAIANNVYADRMGNGNEASGDGWNYRGRGGIMSTGLSAYFLLAKEFGLPLTTEPERLEDPEMAMLAAGYRWSSHGLNQLADKGNLVGVTQDINGGTIGSDDRAQRWGRIQRLLATA